MHGFEPTYEELKLIFIYYIKQPNGSFEPTYEELKLPVPHCLYYVYGQFWAYLWGIETMVIGIGIALVKFCFEPTYEELKLAIVQS